ncbi:MAG: membrane protein insertase YidC [Oscillospiraceae bacterium]|nr:membrane protein insertase YidC [Oscillospiraceae bacterium]
MFDFIARPLGQLLMLFYDFAGSYGLALVLFAVAVKIVLLPFQMKAKKGTMKQSRLQPKMQELQKKHGTNKQKINEEMAKLYKDEGVNPASGCLWGFLPLPIMFALFQAIRRPITMMMNVPDELIEAGGAIYNQLERLNFVPNMQAFYIELEQAQFISSHFEYFRQFVEYGLQQISFELGPINLGQQPLWDFFWHESTNWSYIGGWLPGLLLFLLPILSGGMQFINSAIIRKTSPQMPQQEGAGKSMQTMMMLMPLMSVYFGFILPAALSLYWTVGTILQIFQDLWLNKKYTKILDAEDEERNKLRKAKEAEIEAKRIESERKKAEGITAEDNKNKSKRNKQKEEKQEKREKTAEWEKKNAPPSDKEEAYEPSKVGKRRYARGRAYDPERYGEVSGDEDDSEDERIPELESDVDSAECETTAASDDDVMDEPDDVTLTDDSDETDADVSDEDSASEVQDAKEDIEDKDDEQQDAASTTRFETTRFEDDK